MFRKMTIREIDNEDAYIIIDDDFEERVFPIFVDEEYDWWELVISCYERRELDVVVNLIDWIGKSWIAYFPEINNVLIALKSSSEQSPKLKQYLDKIEKYLLLI